MTNFAPCGPIFKIRNSKLVYSKSYNQITDYIFLITSTFRLLLCYFVHFYTQRSRILKNQHCCPTVHCNDPNFYHSNYQLPCQLPIVSSNFTLTRFSHFRPSVKRLYCIDCAIICVVIGVRNCLPYLFKVPQTKKAVSAPVYCPIEPQKFYFSSYEDTCHEVIC